MVQKNFSSRINFAAFKEMGFDMTEGEHDRLEQMEDEKSGDEKEDDNEKHDPNGEFHEAWVVVQDQDADLIAFGDSTFGYGGLDDEDEGYE